VIAVALAAGLVAWLLIMNRGGGEEATSQEKSVTAVSQSDLQAIAGDSATPIYWAGPMPGMTYELTETGGTNRFVRYLPEGAEVGSSDPHLFVATFPVANAYEATLNEASKTGAVKIPIANGGVAFYPGASPSNVYIAFPGADQQIEVFHPDPAMAHELVGNGAIEPVDVSSAPSTGETTVTSASLAELKALPEEVGHPVYWVGPKAEGTYELTKTPGGRIFIRYLPKGDKVGSPTPRLLVATFPVDDAFGVTERAAQAENAVRVPVGGGAVAFYSTSSPSNVYLAFPGSDYQIEVFDPDPKRAEALVRSGQVEPVSS
jgi:hypothetical protein